MRFGIRKEKKDCSYIYIFEKGKKKPIKLEIPKNAKISRAGDGLQITLYGDILVIISLENVVYVKIEEY